MVIYPYIVIALITAVKAIFSAADTAFTYLNKAEINQLSKKNKKAKRIKTLMEESNKFFGAIEFGTNLAELVASSYASITILNTYTYRIGQTGLSYSTSMYVASLIITIILAYILLLFGGVLPKRFARNNPKEVAFTLVNLVWVLTILLKPFDRIISVSLEFFSKLFKLSDWPQEKLTEKQIKMIITEGREEGIIAGIEKKILFNSLKLEKIIVRRILIPKEKVNFINIEQNFEEILQNIDTYKYTRIPVYENDINNVIGILNIKDLVLEYAKTKKISRDIRNLLREVIFLDSDLKILDAFKILQKKNQAIAVVKNKKGEIIGIITLEDILEKIVGKISDEYDENRENLS